MRQRWVVISNCQTFGLANSINCLAPDVDCTACDIWEFERIVAKEPAHFQGHDLALLMPEAADIAAALNTILPPVRIVPGFRFPPFFPDCVRVEASGVGITDGPIHVYHSMIAVAAYKEGLSADRAASFFNSNVYQVAGYLDQWAAHREYLVTAFDEHGLDIAPIFVKRGRTAPFMHTTDHPKIEILFEIAREVLAKVGQQVHRNVVPPPDNLAATSWPVYPEIGEHLGIAGSYLFKPANEHKPLALDAFLEASLRCFARWDRSQLRVSSALQPVLQRIRQIMRETT